MSKPSFKTGKGKLKKPTNPARPVKFSLPNTKSKVSPQVLPNPIKSQSDEKQYKVIRLENGLVALLISDVHSLKSKLYDTCYDDPPELSEEEDDESESGSSAEEYDDIEGSDGYSDSSGDEECGRRASKHGDSVEEKMAACALCVNVGSYSDPPAIQGLAHFVEHMVFMGSSKYPQENEFDSFIKKHGGSDNAQTDCEATTFYFEVPEEKFAEGMDRFAQFFVSPLMKQDAMQREREAIQSEFALGLPKDSHRMEQLLCQFFPKGHPNNTFMWGDERSLSAPLGPEDSVLYKEAHEFRKKHYSAHRMTVAVQACLPLSTLERYVTSIFSQIPSNNSQPDDFSKHQFNSETVTRELNSLSFLKPMGTKNELYLSWSMKSCLAEYKSKPHDYVSWIIGHEGKGSLISYLRKKVWALNIAVGNSESGIDHTSINCFLEIELILTKEGLLHLNEVIECIFSYINLLKRTCPDERLYKEIKDIKDIDFRFMDEVDPSENVENLSENMHLYPSEHYMTGEDMYYEYNPVLIKYVIECLHPSKVNIMVLSQEHDPPIHYKETEFWFGTKYTRHDITKENIQVWENAEPLPEFHLPEPNIFIPDDFSLIPIPQDLKNALEVLERYKQQQSKSEKLSDTINSTVSKKKTSKKLPTKGMKKVKLNLGSTINFDPLEDKSRVASQADVEKDSACKIVKKYYDAPPELVIDDSLLELWYKPDYKYRLPNASIYIHLMFVAMEKSSKISCMKNLWCNIMMQCLMEKLYPANMAAIDYFIFPSDRGVTIRMSGFSQKLPILVDMLMNAIMEYPLELTEELFTAVKDEQSKAYVNALLKPNKLSKFVRLSLIIHEQNGTLGMLKALKEVNYSDMKNFFKDFAKKIKVKALVQGNMTKEQALDVVKTIKAYMSWQELTEEERPKILVLEIPVGKSICRVESMNVHSVNSNITNYYQWGEYTVKKSVILELIMMLMDEPLFDQLRTKEQLGYTVFPEVKETYGVLGFSVTVYTQANKYTVEHVDSRIQVFLQKFKEQITNLSEKSFAQTKAALIKLKRNEDIALSSETSRNWAKIASLNYKFDQIEQEIEIAKGVTVEELKDFYMEYDERRDNDKFRMLSVQIVGNVQGDVTEEESSKGDVGREIEKIKYLRGEDDGSFVTDVQAFKRNLKVFPEYISRPS